MTILVSDAVKYIQKHDYQLLALVIAIAGIGRGILLAIPATGGRAEYGVYTDYVPVWFWGSLLAVLSLAMIISINRGRYLIAGLAVHIIMLMWVWQAIEATLIGIYPTAWIFFALGFGGFIIFVKIKRGVNE